MKNFTYLIVFLISISCNKGSFLSSVNSPDNKISLDFKLVNGKPFYSINKEDNNEYEDEQILELQAYIRDSSRTVGEVVKELSARVGENIVIKKINRFEIGN